MTENERIILFNRIYLKYCCEMWIHCGDCGKDNRAFSIVSNNEIVMPFGVFAHPSEWDILSLLHEIGHIKTNTDNMRVYEKEYLATQWSANEAKRIGFKINSTWKNIYQNYIWEKRKYSVSRKVKNIPTKEQLIVKW